MIRLQKDSGAAITPLLIAAVCFLVVVTVGYSVYSRTAASSQASQSLQLKPSTNNTNQNNYSILKPATVPSKTAECSQTLSYASNGNPTPVQCSNGQLNILDWQAISALEPTVLKLGYSPTAVQVKAAICKDGNDANLDSSASISAPLEANAYQLASLYYGWHFNIDVISLLASGC